MTIEELEEKYNWVQSINASVKESDDPMQAVMAGAPWLML